MCKTMIASKANYYAIKMAMIIGCTLFYFLIFAQFAFLHCLETVDPAGQLLDISLCAMGLGGLLGCLLAGQKHRLNRGLHWLLAGFAGSTSCALLVSLQPAKAVYPVLGFAIGVFLSVLTVSVAAILHLCLPTKKIGLWTGCSVGSAYFLCNMPIIFQSTAQVQCWYAASACTVGVLLCLSMKNGLQLRTTSMTTAPFSRDDVIREGFHFYKTRGIWVPVVFLLVLVWYDSAAFYVIQEKVSAKNTGLENGVLHWKNGIVHIVAATAAGWALDKRWTFPLLSISLVGLFMGIWGIQDSNRYLWTALYVASVSCYSTVLVAFVALAEKDRGILPARIQAAMIYAMGGWFGSVMGIIMAHDLHNITWIFAAIALAICIFTKMFDTFFAKNDCGQGVPARQRPATLHPTKTTLSQRFYK